MGLLNPKLFFHLCSGWSVQHHAAAILQNAKGFHEKTALQDKAYKTYCKQQTQKKNPVIIPNFPSTSLCQNSIMLPVNSLPSEPHFIRK